jgi:hypothetical protein
MIYSFALNPAFDDMQLQMEVNGPIWATALASAISAGRRTQTSDSLCF